MHWAERFSSKLNRKARYTKRNPSAIILNFLLLPHLPSSLTDFLPSLNLLFTSKADARFIQDGRKAVWSLPYVSVAFFPSLKHGNYTRMLRAILNKSWRQHPTRHQLYGHLPPITKNIQVRRTRHAGHCWRSRDELIRDVLLWTPTHGRAKAGRPVRTYIQQLCEDTGCYPEDLPRAMNDREEWRERVRDIRATSTTWWWWWKCPHVQIAFLKFTSYDNQAFVWCIPIAAVAVHLNLKLSHKMYSNNILNFQESTTISNACTKSLETYWRHNVIVMIIVDFAVLADHCVKLKLSEKCDKYVDLAWELKKIWIMEVTLISIVIGAFGTVTKGLVQGLEDLEIITLLRSTRILRKVLVTWRDLQSHRLQ